MTLQVFYKIVRFLGVIAGVIAVFLVANADLKLSNISVTFKQDSSSASHLSVIFLGDNNQSHRVQNQIRPHNEEQIAYFPLPQHFKVKTVVLDLGWVPSSWELKHIGSWSRFFMIDLPAYEWPMQNIKLVDTVPNDAIVEHRNDRLFVNVNTKQTRFYFSAEQNYSKSTKELLLAKTLYILAIALATYLLFVSHYFWNLFTSRTDDYQSFASQFSATLSKQKLLPLISAILFLVIICILRFSLIKDPGIFIEDAMEVSDIWSGAASPFSLDSYFYYRGYYAFLTESLAHAANLFPIPWQPTLYVWSGLLSMCLAMCVFTYSGLFTSRLILVVAPIVLCLGSFVGPLMYLTITGVLFSSTILLFALTIRPAPNKNITLAFYLLLIAILAWSGPYTSQLIPLSFALLLLNSSGKKNVVLIFILIMAIAYTLSAASGMIQLSNILESGTRVALFNALVHHIFLLELMPGAGWKTGMLIIACIVATLIYFRNDRVYVKHSLLFLGTSLASMATYFLSFKYGQYGGDILDSHTVIAQFCWLVFVLLTVDKFLVSLGTKSVKFVLSGLFLIATCYVLYSKDKLQEKEYELVVDAEVPAFLLAVEEAQKITLGNDEFIQLWYVNQFKQIASVQLGAQHEKAVSVDLSGLPEKVKAFALPVSLERETGMVLYYNKRSNSVAYSHTGVSKKLPKLD